MSAAAVMVSVGDHGVLNKELSGSVSDVWLDASEPNFTRYASLFRRILAALGGTGSNRRSSIASRASRTREGFLSLPKSRSAPVSNRTSQSLEAIPFFHVFPSHILRPFRPLSQDCGIDLVLFDFGNELRSALVLEGGDHGRLNGNPRIRWHGFQYLYQFTGGHSVAPFFRYSNCSRSRAYIIRC
jgi:hypothetical protein